MDALSAQRVERRDDGVYLFVPHMAAFPGVGIQTANVNVRPGDAKFGFQIVVEDADDFEQALLRDGARHRQQR